MMRQTVVLLFLVFLSALLSTAVLAAQTSSPANPSAGNSSSAPPSAQTPGMHRGGAPCWQKAGIEKSVMEQRWGIERETRSQIQAVCSNASLTPQQKNQQVREIHQQDRQKMEGLVTPEQEKALTACRQERGMDRRAGEGPRQSGGCGEWANGGARPGGGAPNAVPGNGGAKPSGQPPNSSSPQN